MKKHLTYMLICAALSASAQWSQLNDPLLRGGCLVSEPFYWSSGIYADDPLLILASQFGTYNSLDYGDDWSFSIDGMNSTSNSPVSIAKLNGKPYVLVNYEDVYTSSDSGKSWTLCTLNGIPSNTFLYTISSVEGCLYLHSYGATYKSLNGTVWSACLDVYTIGSDSLSGVLSGGRTGLVRDSVVIKKIAHYMGNPLTIHMAEPHGPFIYSIDQVSSQVFRCNTRTDTVWSLASSFPFPVPEYNWDWYPTWPVTFFATDSAVFLSLVGESPTGNRYTRLYRSKDHAATWSLLSPGLELPIFMTLKQVNADTIIANDIIGNILFSYDDGDSWVTKSNHFIEHNQQMISVGGSLLIKLLKNSGYRSVKGILRSTDDGSTWSHSNTGLLLLNDMIYDSTLTYGNFDMLFPTGGDTAFCIRQPRYMARTNDEGASWSTATPPDTVGDIVAWYNGDDENFFLVMDQSGTFRYFRTEDNTNSWHEVTSIDPLNLGHTGVCPEQIIGKNDTLFLFHNLQTAGVHTMYVYQSNNNGATWSDVSWGAFGSHHALEVDKVNAGGYYNMVLDFTNRVTKFMVAIAQHDTTDGVTYSHVPTVDTLYMFDNGTWTKINSTGLPSDVDIQTLKFDNGNWILGSNYGVYYSDDDGATWTQPPSKWQQRNATQDGFHKDVKMASMNIHSSRAFVSTLSSGCWYYTGSIRGAEQGVSSGIVPANFTVYPNPNAGEFSIMTKKASGNVQVSIYDVSGRLLFEDSYKPMADNMLINMNMSTEAAGIYLLRVRTDDKVFEKKIVICK